MTAHADVCSRLLSEADFYDSDDFAGIPATKETVARNYREAAALIQQMDSELANCNEASSLKDAAIALNFQCAESAESQLADLRAKIAAAEAGMPSEPIFIINYRLLSGPKTSALNDAIAYIDSILEVCRAQAVRIAEYRHVGVVCRELMKDGKCGQIAWWDTLKDLPDGTGIYAAPQLAAKHD